MFYKITLHNEKIYILSDLRLNLTNFNLNFDISAVAKQCHKLNYSLNYILLNTYNKCISIT